MDTEPMNKPEWVMFGATMPDGTVRLIASKELTEAELRTKAAQEITSWHHRDPVGVIYAHTLTCKMSNYVLIAAQDYPSAFQHLFMTWSPETDEQQQRREIERRMMIEAARTAPPKPLRYNPVTNEIEPE